MNPLVILGPFGLGGWEIMGILVVVLILFGGRKIPELMKGLGKGIREFKNESQQGKSTDSNVTPEKKD